MIKVPLHHHSHHICVVSRIMLTYHFPDFVAMASNTNNRRQYHGILTIHNFSTTTTPTPATATARARTPRVSFSLNKHVHIYVHIHICMYEFGMYVYACVCMNVYSIQVPNTLKTSTSTYMLQRTQSNRPLRCQASGCSSGGSEGARHRMKAGVTSVAMLSS